MNRCITQRLVQAKFNIFWILDVIYRSNPVEILRTMRNIRMCQKLSEIHAEEPEVLKKFPSIEISVDMAPPLFSLEETETKADYKIIIPKAK